MTSLEEAFDTSTTHMTSLEKAFDTSTTQLPLQCEQCTPATTLEKLQQLEEQQNSFTPIYKTGGMCDGNLPTIPGINTACTPTPTPTSTPALNATKCVGEDLLNKIHFRAIWLMNLSKHISNKEQNKFDSIDPKHWKHPPLPSNLYDYYLRTEL